MEDLIHIGFGESAAIGLLGYCVVFLGLVLLMLVVMLLGAVMRRSARSDRRQKASAKAPKEAPHKLQQKPAPAAQERDEPELFDTDPRDAAMVMAIVAYQLGKPMAELHFKSIREIH